MYANMKVDSLKALCRERGLKGYSKLRKAELVAYLETSQKPNMVPTPGTKLALQMDAKAIGIKGYATLKKAALAEVVASPDITRMTCDGLRAICRDRGYKGYSGKNKAALVAHIQTHESKRMAA